MRILQRATPTVTRGIHSDTHTFCRAFGSRAVDTCFYDLGLSRLEYEHPSVRMRVVRSSPLRHRRGHTSLAAISDLGFICRTSKSDGHAKVQWSAPKFEDREI